MFTQSAAVPTSPGLIGTTTTTVTAASPVSPTSRTSRLRGLSYLRNYTQNHLLSREHSPQQQQQQQQHHSATSSPTSPNQNPDPYEHLSRLALPSSNNLTRSVSHSPTTTTAATPATTTSNPPSARLTRFSLVTSSHPLASSSQSSDSQPTISSTSGGAAASSGSSPIMTRTRSATACEPVGSNGAGNLDVLPSIRFSTFYDPRAARPSLTFSPISRTLPTGSEIIRVGRYSERDSQPNVPPNLPSAAPVGFKSKVVSRRHCEFWYEEGKWFIKDVKSSSGTFLNHIRLSPPGTESKPFPINDGDIVQLGIDFKGGEEMIFRCVKMRLELNRGWQSKLNTFNMTTHKRLRNMTASSGSGGAAAQAYSQDCSICLNSIAPCQCLFVAPCSHTWHYKCIRSLLSSPSYPIFICPNCRAAADLEAEVEDPEEWEQLDSDDPSNEQAGAELQPSGSRASSAMHLPAMAPPRKSRESARSVRVQQAATSAPPAPAPAAIPDLLMDDPMQLDSSLPQENFRHTDRSDTPPHIGDTLVPNGPSISHATSDPVPIPSSAGANRSGSGTNRTGAGTNGTSTPNRATRTPSPTGVNPVLMGPEGPITPRNDAGPWVFDGSGVRMRGGEATVGPPQVISLDAAANGDQMDTNGA